MVGERGRNNFRVPRLPDTKHKKRSYPIFVHGNVDPKTPLVQYYNVILLVKKKIDNSQYGFFAFTMVPPDSISYL